VQGLWVLVCWSEHVGPFGQWLHQKWLGDQVRKNNTEPRTLHAILTSIDSRSKGQDSSSTSTPHEGRLNGQVKPMPHSADSKNLIEHCPP
jgi:hypothetical protein